MEYIYTINKRIKQVIKVLTLVFVTLSSSLFSQSIWDNPITGTNPNTANPYTTGQTVNANITVSGIGRGTGITGTNANDRYNATTWNTVALDLNDYFEFTLTPNVGCEIDFTSFVYTGQASGTGPVNFAVRSSVDGFVANIGAPTAGGVTINLSAAAYQNITTPITFRFYGWGGTGGTYSINSFTFNGTTNCGAGNTITTGAVSSPPFALPSCTATASGTVAFTSTGTFAANTYTAQLSNSSGSFAAPTNIGTLVSNANSGSINITIPAGTPSGAGYLIRVISNGPSTIGSNSAAFTITLTCAAASGSCSVGGAMGTSYNTFGCGATPTPCNLASVYSSFGSFCGNSAVACGAGCSTANPSTTYNLEAGCTATIIAEFKARTIAGSDCSNSAMDGSDQISITNSGGVVSAQSSTMAVSVATCGAYPVLGTYTTAVSNLAAGCGNSGGTVKMIITGGAVTIGGTMNRGDEILTYTVNASGTCSICPTLLPVGLIDFYAVKNDNKNDIFWKVDFQEDIQYYMIEKSNDGVNFEQFGIVPAYTTESNSLKNYYLEDYTPYNNITYYRLSVREFNGVVKIFNIVYVDDASSNNWKTNHYQRNQNLIIEFKNTVPKNSTIELYDLSGKLLVEKNVTNSQTTINTEALAEGLYFIKIQSPYKTENFKIIIQK